MCTVIASCSVKGGCGKTTLATNLAAYIAGQDLRVTLLDADVQCSSAMWAERRQRSVMARGTVAYSAVRGEALFDALNNARDVADYALVDCGGTDSQDMRRALLSAHIAYVPVIPSMFDMEATVAMLDVTNAAYKLNTSLHVILVPILLEHTSQDEFLEAHDTIKEIATGLPYLALSPYTIKRRKAYRTSARAGTGVVEGRDSRARAEIQLLGQDLLRTSNSHLYGKPHGL